MSSLANHSLYELLRDLASPLMYLIQNAILIVTAWVAIRAIRENRANVSLEIRNQELIARRRATLDLIIQMGSDEKYHAARSVLSKMRRGGIDPTHLRKIIKDNSPAEAKQREAAQEQFRACQLILNKMALFASGIENGVLDEELFKEYYYSTFMTYIASLRGYIHELRKAVSAEAAEFTSHETIYQEIIQLYNKWRDNPLANKGRGAI